MMNIENEISRHAINLHVASMLMFPQSEFIESDNKLLDDDLIKLDGDLGIQVGCIDQYYIVLKYNRDIDDFKTSHTMFTPAEVFAFIQEIAEGRDPFLGVANYDNQTLLDATHFVDAEVERHPEMTYEDLSVHFGLMSANILQVKSILFLEMMWNYLDNNFKI